jgi:hypothetical protein
MVVGGGVGRMEIMGMGVLGVDGLRMGTMRCRFVDGDNDTNTPKDGDDFTAPTNTYIKYVSYSQQRLSQNYSAGSVDCGAHPFGWTQQLASPSSVIIRVRGRRGLRPLVTV